MSSSRRVRSDLRLLRIYAFTIPTVMRYRPDAAWAQLSAEPRELLGRLEAELAGEASRYRSLFVACLAVLLMPVAARRRSSGQASTGFRCACSGSRSSGASTACRGFLCSSGSRSCSSPRSSCTDGRCFGRAARRPAECRPTWLWSARPSPASARQSPERLFSAIIRGRSCCCERPRRSRRTASFSARSSEREPQRRRSPACRDANREGRRSRRTRSDAVERELGVRVGDRGVGARPPGGRGGVSAGRDRAGALSRGPLSRAASSWRSTRRCSASCGGARRLPASDSQIQWVSVGPPDCVGTRSPWAWPFSAGCSRRRSSAALSAIGIDLPSEDLAVFRLLPGGPLGVVLTVLLLVVVAPLAEEVVYRGVLLSSLESRWGVARWHRRLFGGVLGRASESRRVRSSARFRSAAWLAVLQVALAAGMRRRSCRLQRARGHRDLRVERLGEPVSGSGVHLSLHPDRCDQCGRCVPACPVDAVRVGPSYIGVDWSRCTQCFACVDACKRQAIQRTRDAGARSRDRGAGE